MRPLIVAVFGVLLLSEQSGPRPQSTTVRSQTLFGFFGRPAQTQLRAIDPDSLAAVGANVPILEYHAHAVASPDGLRIAAAIGSPQIGSVRIVNLSTLEFVTTKAGIAAEAVVWLDNDRLVAGLECVPANGAGRGCGLVLIDARSGQIIKRWPDTESDAETLPFEPPLSAPKPAARTPHGAVFLLADAVGVSGALLALVTPDAELKTVSLDHIRVGRVGPGEMLTSTYWVAGPQSSAALAIDHAGNHAYVLGPDPVVADVDLGTLAVQYHDVANLPRLDDVAFRRAFFAGDLLTVFGESRSYDGRRTMADATARGVYSINTTTWAAKVLEPRAASAVLAGDGVIAFGGTLEGIVGIVPDGRPWTLSSANGLAGDVDSVHIITDTAFVVTHDVLGRCRVTTVDAASGRIRRTAQSEHQLVDIVGTAPSR